MDNRIKRGRIIQYMPTPRGSKQGGKMYFAVVISNNKNNCYSTTYNVALISSSQERIHSNIPTHVLITLKKESVIMCEQIDTVDVRDIHAITDWTIHDMSAIDRALAIQLGLTEEYNKWSCNADE